MILGSLPLNYTNFASIQNILIFISFGESLMVYEVSDPNGVVPPADLLPHQHICAHTVASVPRLAAQGLAPATPEIRAAPL